jgi:hypothetical protein
VVLVAGGVLCGGNLQLLCRNLLPVVKAGCTCRVVGDIMVGLRSAALLVQLSHHVVAANVPPLQRCAIDPVAAAVCSI